MSRLLKSYFPMKSTPLAFISTALGALSSVGFKKLLESMPYQEIALVEATFLCLLFGFLRGWDLRGHSIKKNIYVLVGGLLNGLGFLFFFLSLKTLSAVEFSFLGRNQATLSVILGCLLLRERHSIAKWLAIIAALVGAYFFTFVAVDTVLVEGVIFAFFYCLFLSIRGLVLKTGPEASMSQLIFWGSFFGWLIIMADIIVNGVDFDLSRAFLSIKTIVIIGITVLAQAIGISCYFKAIYRGGFSSVSAIRAISPFFVACYSLLIFQYQWTPSRQVGLLFCSLSILLFILGDKKKQPEIELSER